MATSPSVKGDGADRTRTCTPEGTGRCLKRGQTPYKPGMFSAVSALQARGLTALETKPSTKRFCWGWELILERCVVPPGSVQTVPPQN